MCIHKCVCVALLFFLQMANFECVVSAVHVRLDFHTDLISLS